MAWMMRRTMAGDRVREMGSTVPFISMAGRSGGPIMETFKVKGRRTCKRGSGRELKLMPLGCYERGLPGFMYPNLPKKWCCQGQRSYWWKYPGQWQWWKRAYVAWRVVHGHGTMPAENRRKQERPIKIQCKHFRNKNRFREVKKAMYIKIELGMAEWALHMYVISLLIVSL